jgi:hypothetical protein
LLAFHIIRRYLQSLLHPDTLPKGIGNYPAVEVILFANMGLSDGACKSYSNTLIAQFVVKSVTLGHLKISTKKYKRDLTDSDSIFPHIIKPETCRCQQERDKFGTPYSSVAEEETCNLDKFTRNIVKTLQKESESQKQFDNIHLICGEASKTRYYKEIRI